MQEKLLILRKKNNVTGTKMANLLGITLQSYHAKEIGEKQFKTNEMFKIADYFHLKLDDIFLPYEHQNGVKK